MTAARSIDHRVWAGIDYQPAIRAHLPEALLPHLVRGSKVLDVGCGSGIVVRYLAANGMQAEGIDINSSALAEARAVARTNDNPYPVFHESDFLGFESEHRFAAVLMIRFLTCIPDAGSWKACVSKAAALLDTGGLIYVHDFLMDPSSPVYGPRYTEGLSLGWRKGDFPVRRPDGSLQFIAHHHTEADLAQIRSHFQVFSYNSHVSTSMNGNVCLMFEFIGRAHTSS